VVFIKLWEKRDEINPALSIKSYLFTATKNRCLNYIRDNNKFRSNILDLDCGNIDIVNEDDHLEEQELKDRIDKSLAKLPDKCRLVFRMSRYQGLKYKEIASQLDIAQKTVEAHMSKAMRILREELKDYLLWIIYFMT
jgi:RNA polymerase sigma-70 factor (ECF subfamily)